jgi:AraC-like DNA-binding protein
MKNAALAYGEDLFRKLIWPCDGQTVLEAIAELARSVGLSPSAGRRLFYREGGVSLHAVERFLAEKEVLIRAGIKRNEAIRDEAEKRAQELRQLLDDLERTACVDSAASGAASAFGSSLASAGMRSRGRSGGTGSRRRPPSERPASGASTRHAAGWW